MSTPYPGLCPPAPVRAPPFSHAGTLRFVHCNVLSCPWASQSQWVKKRRRSAGDAFDPKSCQFVFGSPAALLSIIQLPVRSACNPSNVAAHPKSSSCRPPVSPQRPKRQQWLHGGGGPLCIRAVHGEQPRLIAVTWVCRVSRRERYGVIPLHPRRNGHLDTRRPHRTRLNPRTPFICVLWPAGLYFPLLRSKQCSLGREGFDQHPLTCPNLNSTEADLGLKNVFGPLKRVLSGAPVPQKMTQSLKHTCFLELPSRPKKDVIISKKQPKCNVCVCGFLP